MTADTPGSPDPTSVPRSLGASPGPGRASGPTRSGLPAPCSLRAAAACAQTVPPRHDSAAAAAPLPAPYSPGWRTARSTCTMTQVILT